MSRACLRQASKPTVRLSRRRPSRRERGAAPLRPFDVVPRRALALAAIFAALTLWRPEPSAADDGAFPLQSPVDALSSAAPSEGPPGLSASEIEKPAASATGAGAATNEGVPAVADATGGDIDAVIGASQSGAPTPDVAETALHAVSKPPTLSRGENDNRAPTPAAEPVAVAGAASAKAPSAPRSEDSAAPPAAARADVARVDIARVDATGVDFALPAPAAPPSAAPRPASPPCAERRRCRVGARSYWFQPPKGWDGETPLPVLIHLHGRDRHGLHVLKNRKVADAAQSLGALLVGPDGRGRDWSTDPGDLEETRFLDKVVTDLAMRLPIDRGRVYLSGYSNGGGLVLRVACLRGPSYAGYLPIAARPLGTPVEDCAGGPARILQVHGATDAVFPSPTTRKLAWSELAAMRTEDHEIARALGRCGPDAAPTREDFHVYRCRHWRGCGAPASLCLHRYGHILPKSWLPYALARLLAEPAGPAERSAARVAPSPPDAPPRR